MKTRCAAAIVCASMILISGCNMHPYESKEGRLMQYRALTTTRISPSSYDSSTPPGYERIRPYHAGTHPGYGPSLRTAPTPAPMPQSNGSGGNSFN